jgi:hypothetical protein
VYTGAAAVSAYSYLDEDDMSSDSATAVASQQSIKAYVDSNAVYGGFQYTFSSGGSSSGTIALDANGNRHIIISVLGFDPTVAGNNLLVRISQTSTGSLLTSNYLSQAADIGGTTVANTTGFIVTNDDGTGTKGNYYGRIELRKGYDSAWTLTSTLIDITNNKVHVAGGMQLNICDGGGVGFAMSSGTWGSWATRIDYL